MSKETTHFDVKPITSNCPIKTTSNTKIINHSGSNEHTTHSNIDNTHYQARESARYDTVEETTVHPMFGGKYLNKMYPAPKSFRVSYKKKEYNIHAWNQQQAMEIFLNTRNITQDELLTIQEISVQKKIKNQHKSNMFLIRNRKNNVNIKKLY
jgi:hypothetical protein